MEKIIRKPNFLYKFKIGDINCNIQLFLIEQEKIEITINTANSANGDYSEYSNIYTLNQLEEISRYFSSFESIEEAMKDISKNIQNKKFSINKNGNTLTFTLKIFFNNNEKSVNFILDKVKLIDLENREQKNSSTNNNSQEKEKEKTNKNVAITSIKELNYLLSNFKDRILSLEKNGTGQSKKDKNNKIRGEEKVKESEDKETEKNSETQK